MAKTSSKPNPAFEKVRSARAHELIVEQLEHRILSGQLPAGSRLPSERAMMGEFQVSRPTVREALRVAEHLGLVSVRQGDPEGPLVIAQPSVGISRIMDGMLQAERASVVELLELRMLLEGAAAALASGRPRAATARIAEAYEQMNAASEPDEFARLDIRFHYEIAVASGNRMYALVLEALNRPIQLLIASRLSSSPGNRTAALAQHAEILRCIRSGDEKCARLSARHHIVDYYSSVLSRPDQSRLKAILEAA